MTEKYVSNPKKIAGALKQVDKLLAKLDKKWNSYTQELENSQRQVDAVKHRILQKIEALDAKISSEKTLLLGYQKQLQMYQKDKESIQQQYIDNKQSVKNNINTCEMRINNLSRERSKQIAKIDKNQQVLDSWKRKNRMEIEFQKQQIESIRSQIESSYS